MKEGALVITTHLEEERVGIVMVVIDDQTVMVRWQDGASFPLYETLDVCCLRRLTKNKKKRG